MTGQGNGRLIAGTVILIIGVIGYVSLAVLLRGDPEAAAIRGSFLFLIAPASALLVSGGTAVQQLTERTKRIERQTNGVLDAKLDQIAETAATRVIAKQQEGSE